MIKPNMSRFKSTSLSGIDEMILEGYNSALQAIPQIKEIIKKIPEIGIIETNNKLIENEYRELLNENSRENLIKIIKTTYLRNKERLDNNKKIGDKDNYYFNLAEKYLYTEIAIVLNISYDEACEYIKKEVSKVVNGK